MGSRAGPLQLVATAADDDVQPVLDKVAQHVAQREPLRAHDGVAVDPLRDQGQSVDAEGLTQLAMTQDALQHLVGVGHAADLNDDPHALVVRLVAQVGDAADFSSGLLQHCLSCPESKEILFLSLFLFLQLLFPFYHPLDFITDGNYELI